MYISLKSGTAHKTRQHSTAGCLHYRVLADSSQQLYITITGNDDGGYYSKEIVSFEKIELPKEPFTSKIFKTAFVGKSTNNAGFLAAILKAEGLIAPVEDAVHKYRALPNLSDWKKRMLALADKAEPYDPVNDNLSDAEIELLQRSTNDKPKPKRGKS